MSQLEIVACSFIVIFGARPVPEHGLLPLLVILPCGLQPCVTPHRMLSFGQSASARRGRREPKRFGCEAHHACVLNASASGSYDMTASVCAHAITTSTLNPHWYQLMINTLISSLGCSCYQSRDFFLREERDLGRDCEHLHIPLRRVQGIVEGLDTL